MKKSKRLKLRYFALQRKILRLWRYCSDGVWRDTRNNWGINTVKTINLSVKSFLNSDLQGKACAMAFRTMLAIVPALALLFAIGRGFGFQIVLENELFGLLPGQESAISETLKVVESYLAHTSGGMFVGVGLVFLLWTLISLVSNVERAFNNIWGIKVGRSLWRKITDYTAMLLILPILMICASGLTFFVSTTLQRVFDFAFMTPLITVGLKFVSWVLTWLFFAAVYALIPYTKVRFKNALIAGIFAGTCFLLLQWAFVSGQIYVTRYNAIYGSFAFIPLMLIWLQLTWVVCLSGAVLCYSSQNIFQFSFSTEISAISDNYRRKVSLAIAAIIVRDFVTGQHIPTRSSIARDYNIPSRLVANVTERLIDAGLINRIYVEDKDESFGFAPAISVDKFTVDLVLHKLQNQGQADFVPGFDEKFPGVVDIVNKISDDQMTPGSAILLTDIKIF